MTKEFFELDHDIDAVAKDGRALDALAEYIHQAFSSDTAESDAAHSPPSNLSPDLEKNKRNEMERGETMWLSETDSSATKRDDCIGLEKPMADNNEIAFDGQERNPWSGSFVGVQVNYFCQGFISDGSTNILYPILVVQKGETSTYVAAAASLVKLCWSYKIFFGVISDCFPIFGLHRKPYITSGWVLSAAMMVVLASFGNDISATNLVSMLALANMGFVMADVSADAYVVWMAHRESVKKRGGVQALAYLMREGGRILINLIILLGFSGPSVLCPGYESDPNVPCTIDQSVVSRNTLSQDYPESWCHMTCSAATFGFGLTIRQYSWIIAVIVLLGIPTYFKLFEEKSERENFFKKMKDFWEVMRRRSVWQLMLYSMVSNITYGVRVVPKSNANYVWLGLTPLQNQGVNIIESIVFAVGLSLIRKYALNYSWRKLIWMGKGLTTIFQLLYILIALNIWRNAWFYMFTDVSDSFIHSLNVMATLFAIVEVSEPGFEAITFALVTSASNAVRPLATVISFQLLAFMPGLNTQAGLATDTPQIRNQFTLLLLLVEVLNMTSLIALPLLPRQKEEARALVAKGEMSSFWARFTLISGLIFLLYSTIITCLTIVDNDTIRCYKLLGGAGCTVNESSAPVYFLIGCCFVYCYGTTFALAFWPIILGKEKFSWGMFF